MGENSKIEWTDHTFNPWIGCTKVSKGCMNCYAERDMDHRFGKAEWGSRGTRVRTSNANWKKPLKWNKRAKGNGKPELVFCASLADVFEDYEGHGINLQDWRDDLFDLMTNTPWLIWLVLTKRPENVLDLVPGKWRTVGKWPLNVWVGFSAEDQSNFDYRISTAINIPTPVLWVSAEPMLGPIDFSEYYNDIDWWIVGGESGPGARPLAEKWANTAMYHCHKSRTPIFFKQWGEWFPNEQMEYHPIHGPAWRSGLEDIQIEYHKPTSTWKLGRKSAGDLYWGKEEKGFPQKAIDAYREYLQLFV